MARATFGGTAADTVARRVKVLGHDVDDYEAATLTVWSAQTGGTQYTDLLVNGAASNSVPVDSTGQVPEFQGPDGVTVVWVSAGGARVKMLPAEGPTDTSVAGYVNDSASSTRTALGVALGYLSKAPTDGSDARATLATEIANCVTNGLDLILPAGTISVSLGAVSGFAGYYAGIVVPSGIRIRGRGRGLTTIKLMDAQTHGIDLGDAVSVVYNKTLSGGDESITIEDLTVDGNAANQTHLHNGITLIRTRGCRLSRVRVKNVRGVGNTPPNETFHFDTQLGTDTTFTDCDAVSDPGVQTASGFSANNATGVHYAGCIARGMKDSMGFTLYQCEEVSYTGCRSYKSGSNGFNAEESRDVTYSSCHSGGEVATGTTPYPDTAGTSLGDGRGFVINGTRNTLLVGCTARKSVGAGLTIVEGANGASGRVVGCSFTENERGVSCANMPTLARWFIDYSTKVDSNTTTNYDFPIGYNDGPGHQLATPAVPASSVAYTNPYPFRCSVYLVGGTLTLFQINGTGIDNATKQVVLDPGMTVQMWYSSAPTWVWYGL